MKLRSCPQGFGKGHLMLKPPCKAYFNATSAYVRAEP
jgi:hypothetical protein